MKNKAEILVVLNIKSTKNFEKNVQKLLPKNVKELYLSSCGMNRASGYGSYNYFLDLEVNGERMTFTKFTHDSQAFDNYQDFELGQRNYENWVKGTVLSLLEDNFEILKEF